MTRSRNDQRRGPLGRAADRSERAEAHRTGRQSTTEARAGRIDETLSRITAAHAGLALPPGKDSENRENRENREHENVEEYATPRWRRRPTAGKLAVAALAVLVFVATTFGWAAKSWLGSVVPDAGALDLESGAIIDVAAQDGDENVLIVAGDPGGAGNLAGTVAVAHIPDGGGPVVVMSFPADLEINRPPCQRWDPAAATYRDETVPAEPRTQLRTALDIGGPRCTTRVVQQLSGVAITQYIGMDLGALGSVAQALGGIEVCTPAPVLDAVLGPIVPDPGVTTLDGLHATDYARAGAVQGEPGTAYGRIERQQRVLAAVLDAALSGAALLDVGQLVDVRSALGAALVADGAGLDAMLATALSLHRLDADGVVLAPVPTNGAPNSRGHSVLRDADASALFRAVREDAPLPEQADDPRAADPGPAPADVTVEVLNASERTGIAGEVGDTLRSLGFVIGDVGNAEQPSAETVIRYSPDQAAAAELLATTVPAATSVPEPGTTGSLQLVLGRSFDGVVRAPTEPGSGSQAAATPTATATCA